jgi:hypothetical protein
MYKVVLVCNISCISFVFVRYFFQKNENAELL